MELSQSTFDELRRLIHRLCGLALAEDKRYLVQHRLEPVVRSSGCQDFDQFLRKAERQRGSPVAGSDHRGHHHAGDVVLSRSPSL